MCRLKRQTRRGWGQSRGALVETPDAVAAMVRLHEVGWGTRRIARELGCSRTTVQHYLTAGEWRGYRRRGRRSKLAGETPWLRERLIRHHENADVVRQDLERERGITVSLRTLERAVAPFRAEFEAEARATLRMNELTEAVELIQSLGGGWWNRVDVAGEPLQPLQPLQAPQPPPGERP